VVAALGDARGTVGAVVWPRELATTELDGGDHGAEARPWWRGGGGGVGAVEGWGPARRGEGTAHI
jgi:hypothetical protein